MSYLWAAATNIYNWITGSREEIGETEEIIATFQEGGLDRLQR